MLQQCRKQHLLSSFDITVMKTPLLSILVSSLHGTIARHLRLQLSLSNHPFLCHDSGLDQLVHLSCLHSFPTLLSHVVLGCPVVFPSGCHSNASHAAIVALHSEHVTNPHS